MANHIELISLILNLVFGGGFLVTFLTLRSARMKAGAEAKGAEANAESTELDNVEKAIKIWREMAESLKAELQVSRSNYEVIAQEVSGLKRSVRALNMTNQKILKLLSGISHENFAQVAEEIQNEITKSEKQDA